MFLSISFQLSDQVGLPEVLFAERRAALLKVEIRHRLEPVLLEMARATTKRIGRC